MSRLYYAPKYRVKATMQPMDQPPNNGGPPSVKPVNEYLKKIGLMVPSEVLAFFLAVNGVVHPQAGNSASHIMDLAFVAGLIVTPIYLLRMSRNDPAPAPKVTHIVLSTLAFGVWAYSIAGETLSLPYDSVIASVLPMFFMLIAGLVPYDK